jgi:hypothetical protein
MPAPPQRRNFVENNASGTTGCDDATRRAHYSITPLPPPQNRAADSLINLLLRANVCPTIQTKGLATCKNDALKGSLLNCIVAGAISHKVTRHVSIPAFRFIGGGRR